MSIVKSKNFSYIRGPKGDKGDRGEPGSGVAAATGRITYNTTTRTIGFNDAGLVTQEYVDTTISNVVESAINELVSGAPDLLDTLNELANALGNDNNFANTVVFKSGATMTGALILSGDPTNNLGAVTKQYVDNITISSTTDLPEGTHLYYTTTRANTDFDARFATKSTTNLTEGSNLYYTTSRANTDFDARLATKSTTNLTEGSNLYYTTARSNTDFDTRLALKSTTNLVEGTNLYYTTTRVNTDFDTRLATKTTSNLTEGTNKYYTDVRARASITVTGDLNYNNSTGVMNYTTPFIPTDISDLTDNLGLLVTGTLPDGTLVDGGTY